MHSFSSSAINVPLYFVKPVKCIRPHPIYIMNLKTMYFQCKNQIHATLQHWSILEIRGS